jgi:hypothetical protein
MDVGVAVKFFYGDVGELNGSRHAVDSMAGNGTHRIFAARELRGDENMHFVHGSHIEEYAQELAAAFDQYVCHAATAEFFKERIEASGVCVPGALKDFGTGIRQTVCRLARGLARRRQQQWNLAGRLDQSTINRKGGSRIYDDSRGRAPYFRRVCRTCSQERVIGASRSAAHDDRIHPSANLVDDAS